MAGLINDYPDFISLDFSKFVAKPIRANEGGKGKSVYVDGPTHYGGIGGVTARLGDDLPLLFPIRPNMNVTELKGDEESKRLNVELGIPAEYEALGTKLRSFDAWCVEQGFLANTSADDKAVWYPDLKKQLASMPPEMGRIMVLGKYKAFLKKGNSSNGKTYSDSVRVKADGWFDDIRELQLEEKTIKGAKTTVVKDCLWKDRLVSAGPLTAKDTKFFLYVAKLGRYTPTVPCMGPDGKPVITGTSAEGKPIYQMRWVGPQDAKQYSRITPVVGLSKLYVSSEFGPTVVAKELYVKAAPPRAKSRLPGCDVDASISAEDSLAALTETAEASEEVAKAEAAPLSDDEGTHGTNAGSGSVPPASPVSPARAAAVTEEPASATGERVGRKRKERPTDEEEEAPKKNKKARTYVSDEF